MSEYRHVAVCHDCNIKSIHKKDRNYYTCFNCGSGKVSEYLEQDRVGRGLHQFLDGEAEFVG